MPWGRGVDAVDDHGIAEVVEGVAERWHKDDGACRPGLVVGAGKPPSVVSLATDTERLLAPGALSRGQALLLRQIKQLLENVPHSMGVTVVNPLQVEA